MEPLSSGKANVGYLSRAFRPSISKRNLIETKKWIYICHTPSLASRVVRSMFKMPRNRPAEVVKMQWLLAGAGRITLACPR